MYEVRRYHLSNSFKNVNAMMGKEGEERLRLRTPKAHDSQAQHVFLDRTLYQRGTTSVFFSLKDAIGTTGETRRGLRIRMRCCYCPDFVISTVMIL